MKLNTRGRYGVRLLTELARREFDGCPVGLRSVAATTGLPMRYLEQIVRPLRKADLIRSRTGRAGGYTLSRPAQSIPLRDVLDAAVGQIQLMGCVDEPDSCSRSSACPTRGVWNAVTLDLRAVLEGYSLADLTAGAGAPCREPINAARSRRGPRRARGRSTGAKAKPRR